jgi:hypothetical protein
MLAAEATKEDAIVRNPYLPFIAAGFEIDNHVKIKDDEFGKKIHPLSVGHVNFYKTRFDTAPDRVFQFSDEEYKYVSSFGAIRYVCHDPPPSPVTYDVTYFDDSCEVSYDGEFLIVRCSEDALESLKKDMKDNQYSVLHEKLIGNSIFVSATYQPSTSLEIITIPNVDLPGLKILRESCSLKEHIRGDINCYGRRCEYKDYVIGIYRGNGIDRPVKLLSSNLCNDSDWLIPSRHQIESRGRDLQDFTISRYYAEDVRKSLKWFPDLAVVAVAIAMTPHEYSDEFATNKLLKVRNVGNDVIITIDAEEFEFDTPMKFVTKVISYEWGVDYIEHLLVLDRPKAIIVRQLSNYVGNDRADECFHLLLKERILMNSGRSKFDTAKKVLGRALYQTKKTREVIDWF